MEWKTLLSTEKLASEIAEPAAFKYYPMNEFEKDYSKERSVLLGYFNQTVIQSSR